MNPSMTASPSSSEQPESQTIGEEFRPFQRFQGNSMIPEELCRYVGIGAGAKICWGRLARYQGSAGDAFPSMQTLGVELGVSERQARAYVAELERDRFIRRKMVAGKTNRVVFLWHVCFTAPRKDTSAPDRKTSSALPRKDTSAHPGRLLPPKRVNEESRRQESQVEESQVFEESKKRLNIPKPKIDDDDQKPKYASERDELTAVIHNSTGIRPDTRLLRDITDALELRGGTLRAFLDEMPPRVERLTKPPGPGFFISQAKQWAGDGPRLAPEPRVQTVIAPCTCRYGVVELPDGSTADCTNCATGLDLVRVKARIAKERNALPLAPTSGAAHSQVA